MDKHPSRQELIQAAAKGTGEFNQHLSVCADCRELFELFAAFQVAGELPLPDAPSGWIAKAKQISEEANPLRALRGLVAKLSFDSWQMPTAVGVRSHEASSDRRIRFEAGPIILDVRAERHQLGWDFTAQVSGDISDPTALTLFADKMAVAPDANGFYQWSSPRPPRTIRLQADNTSLALPELSWKEVPGK